jgi:fibronectin type 3 domain-containing protein
VAPVPPVFTGVRSQPGGVALTWVRSSSEDVREQVLLRKHKYSTQWTELARFAKDSVTYTDKIPDPRNEYQYRLVAVDESGNRSIPSNPVTGKSLDTGSRAVVKGLRAEVDRTEKSIRLHWTYTQDRLSKYVIYRAKNDEQMSLYKSVPADSQGLIDTGVSMNTNYRYRVKAVFKDGAESPFSEEIKVEY